MRTRVAVGLVLVMALLVVAGGALLARSDEVAAGVLIVPTKVVLFTAAGKGFRPNIITIKKNTSIAFVNVDTSVDHTVTKESGPGVAFDDLIVVGKNKIRKFTAAGTYTYHCRFHSLDMQGTIIVQCAFADAGTCGLGGGYKRAGHVTAFAGEAMRRGRGLSPRPDFTPDDATSDRAVESLPCAFVGQTLTQAARAATRAARSYTPSSAPRSAGLAARKSGCDSPISAPWKP